MSRILRLAKDTCSRVGLIKDLAPKVAVVRLSGAISSSGMQSLNLANYAQKLNSAFDVRDVKAVALLLNSPGGSAVQSNLIATRIRALSTEKRIPVVVFIEDVAASGGYWIAAAGDEIYADESSFVGSIGCISQSFGFAEFLKQHGIERRLHTAGDRKSLVDPFLPERAEDLQRLTRLIGDIHELFKQHVISTHLFVDSLALNR